MAINNPFKVGDKVVRRPECQHSPLWTHGGHVVKVTATDTYTTGGPIVCVDAAPGTVFDAGCFRAAIAGLDYPLPPADAEQVTANSGHLPDGSGVRKHSAGPLYPCVLVFRDGHLGGKHDVGVISPRNQEPMWFSNSNAAIAVADIIKKDLKS